MTLTDTPAPTPPSPEPPAARPIRWKEIVAVWLVLTAITVVGDLVVFPRVMPRSASTTMHLTIVTVVLFSVTAAPVGSLVYAGAVYALRHWRAGSGDEPPPEGPPYRKHNQLSIAWLSISAMLAVFLLVWGLGALAADNAVAQKATMTVDATGQQWLWTFHYPGTKVTTETPYLPVGRTVTFDVTSLDVTHSFWIVQMGAKIDANPGEVTTVSVTPTRIGDFDVRCAELCGLYHAFMTTQIHVVSASQYQSWLQTQELSA